MINISNEKVRKIFAAENNGGDNIVQSSCSCVNPSRMFYFTPEEIEKDVNGN